MSLSPKALFRKPKAQPLIRAGDQARDTRNWLGAAEAYGRALKIKPERADVWVQLGHVRKESGDISGAEAAYLTSLRLAPKVADTHVQLGHLRRLQKRLEDAATHFLDAAELDPALQYPVDALTQLSAQGVKMDMVRAQAVARRAGQTTFAAPQALTMELVAQQLDAALARLAPAIREENAALIQALMGGVAAAEKLAPQMSAATDQDAGLHLVFDISDLAGYFNVARLPTGIQRVQIEVISSLLQSPRAGLDVAVCTFSKERDLWVEVPSDLFLRLCALSLESGDIQDPVWKTAVRGLKVLTDLSPEFVFRRGACLVNLGTSWWLQNYFLHVRKAKALYGIHYVPFVHDMIPIMTPEHCVRELTQDFISWALGVFAHADHFLTNSEASKRDLLAVADQLGHAVDPTNVHVVRLDADFRKPSTAVPTAQTLARYGLTEGGFVLFVSTIESRKNHLNAFKAWLELIQRHGADKIPRLVCVGNRGWLNDPVFNKLETDRDLRAKVMIVSGVSDPDLANLYRASAFTLYPSTYEGWGLPVTESFCYGKAALLSDASSLPEAGGDFADYFRVGDQVEFVALLERLMLDLPYRRSREQNIVDHFQPRPWRDLGFEIGDQMLAWFPASQADALPAAHAPTMGRYYSLRRVDALAIHRSMESAERFRSGEGWWFPDDWGNWTKPRGGQLTLRLQPGDQPLRLYVGLRGLTEDKQPYTITLSGTAARTDALEPQETRWAALRIAPDAFASGELVIGLKGEAFDDFAIGTKGVDTRKSGLGVVGFMICEESDLLSRADFMEAVALDQLSDFDQQ